jgi:hypothetical protein
MTPTDQQVGELDRRLTRLEPLVRQRRGGGASYPPGGDPGEILAYVGPGPNDVAWISPAAGTGDLTYVHTQGAPSATWVITHGLGKYPAVDVVDSGGSVLIPSVHYDSVTQVTLSFGSPTTGKAFVN